MKNKKIWIKFDKEAILKNFSFIAKSRKRSLPEMWQFFISCRKEEISKQEKKIEKAKRKILREKEYIKLAEKEIKELTKIDVRCPKCKQLNSAQLSDLGHSFVCCHCNDSFGLDIEHITGQSSGPKREWDNGGG